MGTDREVCHRSESASCTKDLGHFCRAMKTRRAISVSISLARILAAVVGAVGGSAGGVGAGAFVAGDDSATT